MQREGGRVLAYLSSFLLAFLLRVLLLARAGLTAQEPYIFFVHNKSMEHVLPPYCSDSVSQLWSGGTTGRGGRIIQAPLCFHSVFGLWLGNQWERLGHLSKEDCSESIYPIISFNPPPPNCKWKLAVLVAADLGQIWIDDKKEKDPISHIIQLFSNLCHNHCSVFFNDTYCIIKLAACQLWNRSCTRC